MTQCRRLLAVTLVLSAAAAQANAAAYTYATFDVPGTSTIDTGASTIANGINDAGQVTGY